MPIRLIKRLKDLEKNETPLAIISGGKNNNEIVAISENNDNKKLKKKHELNIDDGEIIPFLNKDGPCRVLISGPTKSGKSHLIGQMLQNVTKPVNVFSRLDEDQSIDKFADVERVNFDDILEEPVDLEDLKDSVVLFDDFEAHPNKKVVKELIDLNNKVLECGRHYGINGVIRTSHILLNNRATLYPLLESNCVICFHRGGGKKHMIDFLRKYHGMTNQKINDMTSKTRGRWVGFYLNSPQALISPNKVMMIE